MTHEEYLDAAVRLALKSVERDKGGPFGALVVRDGRILGTGTNRVTAALDPSAHAEVVAIREACRAVGDYRLGDSILYASCMPCPMCYATAFWARIERVYYAATGEQAAAAGFDDLTVAAALAQTASARTLPCIRLHRPDAGCPFDLWQAAPQRKEY